MNRRNAFAGGVLDSAFSLIEMLVVISILTVLVSLLVPTLSKAREQARRVLCMTNQKQMYLTFAVYASDNKEFLPSGSFYGLQSIDYSQGPLLYNEYNVTAKMINCPSVPSLKEGGSWGEGDPRSNYMWRPMLPGIQPGGGIARTDMSFIGYAYFGGYSDCDLYDYGIPPNPALDGIPNENAVWYGWTRRWGLLPILNKIGPTVKHNSTYAYRYDPPSRRPLMWDPTWKAGTAGDNWRGISPYSNHHGDGPDLGGGEGGNFTYADGHGQWANNADLTVFFVGGQGGQSHYMKAD